NIVTGTSVLVGGSGAPLVNIGHEFGQPTFGIRSIPGVAAGILLHFQSRGGNAAGVGGLAGSKQYACFAERAHGLGGARHVRPFGDGLDAAVDQARGVVDVEVVLCCRRHRHVNVVFAGQVPHAGASCESRVTPAPGDVFVDASAFGLFDFANNLQVNAIGVINTARRVGAGDHGSAEFANLLDRVNRHISGAGHHHAGAVETQSLDAKHLLGNKDCSVTGGLGTHERTAPGHALAGQHSGLVLIGHPLVLTE